MRNFKYISRMLQIIIFVAVLAMCEIIASNVMVQPGYSHYFNHDVQKIINNEDDVEMIILGASRTYRTFVPKVIEEKFGFSNVLNAGSSSQPIDGTYYQLKYLLTKFSPRYVIVGVTWNGLRAGGGNTAKTYCF